MAQARHRRSRSTTLVAVTATVVTAAVVLGMLAGLAWWNDSTRSASDESAPAASAAPMPSGDPFAPPSDSAIGGLGTGQGTAADSIENIAFILADDLDWATFEQVSRLAALPAQGTTFANTVVTDSLCCPSRVSILRSQYVHNHNVVSNRLDSGGGWPTFNALGLENDCLPVWLTGVGVRTALIGKYLNEYPNGGPPTYIPPGWSEWVVPVTQGPAYTGYDYTLNENGTLVSYGRAPEDFLGDVLIDRAVSFIETTSTPFYLQLSLMNPHNPSPVAPRHKGSGAELEIPRSPAFNARSTGEPPWRADLPGIGKKRLNRLDAAWRQRVASSQTVADAVEAVTDALTRAGKLETTLIVVGSDNGYHAVNRRLPAGKRTPYREDTVVPLVFIGPGVPVGATVNALTSTIDLGPTFAELMGAATPEWADGRSLTPFLDGPAGSGWRTGILSESLGDSAPGDPDYQTLRPPKFAALRTPEWLYVEYLDGERELYALIADPYEVRNVIDAVDEATLAPLQAQLAALRDCAGPTCRTADGLPN